MSRHHPSNHREIQAGSRWWKVDFHTHTGHSTDAYAGGDYTDREWLLAHMRQEIDAVCITDHNGGRQIDLLKAEYEKMHIEYLLSEEDAEEDFREIILFPGAELTTSSGYHCLIILDPTHGSAEISRILGLGSLEGQEGSPASKWNENPRNLKSPIDYLLIPAHVDGAKGLFRERILKHAPELLEVDEVVLHIDADEREKTLKMLEPKVLERSRRATTDPDIIGFEGVFVYGSDSHEFSEIGLRSTWVKMEEATLDSLKIAIADRTGSIRDCLSPVEPTCPDKWISKISIQDARHMGRLTLPNGSAGDPLILNLNPGLNAIIGGRGSGKSTILEMLRWVTNRSAELDSYDGDELRSQHESLVNDSFHDIGGNAIIEVEFRFYGSQSKIRYDRNNTVHELLESDGNNGWNQVALEKNEWVARLPFRIYSQKQLYRFRKDTSLLLKEIDQTLEVGASSIERRLDDLHSKSLTLRGEVVALSGSLRSKKATQVELAEIKKRIALLEDSKNSKILTEFSLRSRQGTQITQWLNQLSEIRREISDVVSGIEVPPLELEKAMVDGDEEVAEMEVEVYSREIYESYRAAIEEIENQVTNLDLADKKWNAAHIDGEWQNLEANARAAYDDLAGKLTSESEKPVDPKLYKSLVEKRKELELELAKLEKIEKLREESLKEYKKTCEEFLKTRIELSEKREGFLRDTFAGREDLKLSIKRFGDRRQAEASLRGILHRSDSSSEEFTAIIRALFPDNNPPSLTVIEDLKRDLNAAKKLDTKHTSENLGILFGKRFVDHIQGLTQEDLGRLELWFPADKLHVKIQKDGITGGYTNLDKASPGQVATAVLAFLLAYGDQPLVLDQPEDDLDNKMIFNIIVTDLVANKSKRQVIIVTHNANLVVNANADLILPLESDNGISSIPCRGALQSAEVRKSVCLIMEGGPTALEQRFNRMIKRNAD
jgi:ABC-type lipoprotein export system ATPase subunit